MFGLASFELVDAPGIPSVEDLPYKVFTTSGRAAIFQALLQIQLPPDSVVLVPTYHCPTMVAPVLLAGHRPVYFGIRPDGLPDVDGIDATASAHARAMLVSHYFGLAQSLHEVRAWCDARGIVLVEDCAHCYFGQAGDRPVGAWGDYCTASLSKFFPVPEAGLLGSHTRPLTPLALRRQGLKSQVKGLVDVLETGTKHQRLGYFNHSLAGVFRLKHKAEPLSMPEQPGASPISADAMLEACDMARIDRRPLAISMLLRRMLPRGRIITQRQRNFSLYAEMLSDLNGARPLVALPTKPVAPYVFPLWVDDADRVYHALRTQGAPVFRWDRIWPDTPALPHDAGLQWSEHVLQLLCHQDLYEADIRQTVQHLKTVLNLVPATPGQENASMTQAEPCLY